MDHINKLKTNDSALTKEIVFTGAEGGQGWTICCWDLSSRAVKTSYKGNSTKANTLSVINGEYVISADACKPLIHVWALNRRELHLRIPCPGLVTALAITSDGAYCAAAIAYKIYVWQVSTGDMMVVFNSNQVNCLHFTRNMKFLISGGSTTVCAWSLAKILSNCSSGDSLSCLHKFTHENSVTAVRGGSAVVLTASVDKTVRVWSLQNGRLIQNIAFTAPLSALEWSPSEDVAYAGTMDGDIYEITSLFENAVLRKFVNVRAEKKRVVFKKDRRVTCMTLSTDGRILVAGSLQGKVYLWNTRSRYLVTSAHLNASGTITSCVAVNMSLDFRKPLYPVASFKKQKSDEKDGKVRFLLRHIKNDFQLELDLSDDKFEKSLTKGLTLLDDFGRAGNKGEQYAKNWTRLIEQLLSGLHDVLDQLQSQFETDSKVFQRPSSIQLTMKPVPSDAPSRLSVLRVQYEQLSAALCLLLSGFGLEYPTVVDLPLTFVVDLLTRTFSVNPPRLLEKQTAARIDLAEIVPFLHVAAVRVLRSLMLCAKSLLLSHVDTINGQLVSTLSYSRMATADEASRRQCYSELRCEIYAAAVTSVFYGLAGDPTCFASFFDALIHEATEDARPIDSATNESEVRTNQAISMANAYWLQVAKKRKKAKGDRTVMTETPQTESTMKSALKTKSVSSEKLRKSALKVLKRVIVSDGQLLQRSLLKKIADIFRNVQEEDAEAEVVFQMAENLSHHSMLFPERRVDSDENGKLNLDIQLGSVEPMSIETRNISSCRPKRKQSCEEDCEINCSEVLEQKKARIDLEGKVEDKASPVRNETSEEDAEECESKEIQDEEEDGKEQDVEEEEEEEEDEHIDEDEVLAEERVADSPPLCPPVQSSEQTPQVNLTNSSAVHQVGEDDGIVVDAGTITLEEMKSWFFAG